MGKVHIYCGDGKGKTTAAIGLSIRAMGAGYDVIFLQFLKTSPTGELTIFKELENIEVIRSEKPMKFTFMMNQNELDECKEINHEMLRKIINCEYVEKTLIVLDESIGSIGAGVLDEGLILELLSVHSKCEIVLTGRNPSEVLLNKADYITEMKKLKHPYDQALDARKGIEF